MSIPVILYISNMPVLLAMFLLLGALGLSAGILVFSNLILAGQDSEVRWHTSQRRISGGAISLFVLILYGLLLGSYFVLRFQAQWTENDTSSLTQAIETLRREATLQPASGVVYPHGFNYQASSLMLSLFTGVPTQTLQAILWPLVAPLVLVITSFIFYNQVTEGRRIATLAVLLLLFQADTLFVILRGSHEKLGWPLMMIALILLSLSVGSPIRKMAMYVVLFYLAFFGMVATNVFFASTFVVAVAFSLALGLLIAVLLRHRFSLITDIHRLFYVLLSCFLLIFVFIVYIYPPALSNIRTLQTVLEQVSVFLLGFEPQGQPYEYISYGWVSPLAYFGLSLFTWMLIPASFAAWLWRGKEILKGGQTFGIRENLVWLLYAGFSIQVAIGIVVDFSGALAQNLQLRLIPGFSVLAAVLLAQGIQRVISTRQFRQPGRTLALSITVLAVIWFAIASPLKATNEPVLSNKWGFYSRSEDVSVGWIEENLRMSSIWSGIDERIRQLYLFKYASQSASSNVYDASQFETDDPYILYSEREQMRGMRMGISMPPVSNRNRVYDNGDVFLYHRRPLTPFQR